MTFLTYQVRLKHTHFYTPMATGHAHDKATKIWSLPFALVISLIFGIKSGLIGGLAFAIGGLWLSPDLDTRSRAQQRWGKLQKMWWPYRKLIRHRSVFSHGPFIGTAIRLAYLLTFITLFILFLHIIGIKAPFISPQMLIQLIRTYPHYSLPIILGLEASAWLHLIKDGDPFPIELHQWIRR